MQANLIHGKTVKPRVLSATLSMIAVLTLNYNALLEYFVVSLVIFFWLLREVVVGSVRGGSLGNRGDFHAWDVLPILVVFAWMYGVLIGVMTGNRTEWVFRNFAGMTLYLLYYWLVRARIESRTLIRIWISVGFAVASIFVLLFLDVVFLRSGLSGLLPIQIILGRIIGGSSTGQVRVYSVVLVILFPVYARGLSKMLNLEQPVRNALLAALTAFVLGFVAASKGFMLGLIVITVILLAEAVIRAGLRLWRTQNLLLAPMLAGIGVVIIFAAGYQTVITEMFARSDRSNAIRYEQLVFLLRDLSFFGRGLGAVVENYVRNARLPYGFELTYLNLFHKVGIVAVAVLVTYVAVFVRYFRTSDSAVRERAFAIGCLGYLFPAIGNPILFAPLAVFSHVVALYLLRRA